MKQGKKQRISQTIALLFIGALSSSILPGYAMEISSATLAKQLKTIEPPKPIKRVNPKYPLDAARNGRTGWAKFSFIVEADGSVSNIVTLDSSGSQDIEREALKAIKRWKYEPALVDGKPVQRCFNTVQMDFAMAGGDENYGVRNRFRAKYNKAQESLKKKEFVEVRTLIDEMSSMKNRYAAEHNYLQSLKAAYFKQTGDKVRQLDSLSNIHFFKVKDNVSKNAEQHEFSVLHQQFVLSVELNRLKQAFDVYERLTALPSAEKYLASYKKTLDKVASFVASDSNIVVDTVIEGQPFWSHYLVRNNFTFANIDGNLSKLEVRCNNKYHVFNINEQSSWQIPQSWQGCSIMVYGEENTQFSLVELAEREQI